MTPAAKPSVWAMPRSIVREGGVIKSIAFRTSSTPVTVRVERIETVSAEGRQELPPEIIDGAKS